MSISRHVSEDGTIYLRTQHGESSEEIATALAPYTGRTMRVDLPNDYGHYHRYSATMLKISGTVVTVEASVEGKKFTAEVDAFDGFGSHCTIIDPEGE